MHEDFWQERWARNEIGFHLREVNPYLQRHWPDLELASGAQVLVPLCGKSLDMAWLAGQGYRVLGVELAESAVIAFFAEQELTPEIDQYGAFRRRLQAQRTRAETARATGAPIWRLGPHAPTAHSCQQAPSTAPRPPDVGTVVKMLWAGRRAS